MRIIGSISSLALRIFLNVAILGSVFLASQSDAANLITLATFNDANGSGPYAGLSVGPSGKLYGTTLYGGTHGYGALFQVDPATGELTTLLSLNGNMDGTTGSRPYGGVIAAADGNLYGTMYIGGAVASGTIFKFQVDAGAFTTLASFQRRNGGGPLTDLIFGDGKLYGTTGDGGRRGYGTVFEFDLASGSLDALVSFDHDTNGGRPYGRLVFDVDGNLYGTTYQGGPERYGTIFRIDHDTGFFTTLAAFNGANGRGSHSGLTIDAAGNFYGTTQQGGANDLGTIFKLDRSTGVLTTLLSFNGANGSYPEAGMIADAAGNLYGTTREGGGEQLRHGVHARSAHRRAQHARHVQSRQRRPSMLRIDCRRQRQSVRNNVRHQHGRRHGLQADRHRLRRPRRSRTDKPRALAPGDRRARMPATSTRR